MASCVAASARWKASSPGTVWTWNAIGKQGGAWGLAADAPEATTGFLLNHLICEHLPKRGDDGRRITNSDPITGQAAWFDVRVRPDEVRKAASTERRPARRRSPTRPASRVPP
jgi:hypothetical protein